MGGYTLKREIELKEVREPEGAVYKLAGAGIGTDIVSYKICRITTGSKTSEQVLEEAEELCMLVSGRCVLTIGKNHLQVEAPAYIKVPPTVPRIISNPYDREAVLILISPVEGSFDYDVYSREETKGLRACSDWELPSALGTGGVWLQRLEYVLGLKQISVSFTDLKPGVGMGHHKHETVEEVYFSLQGPSEVHIEDRKFDAPAYTFLRCDPPVMRSVHNNRNSRKNVRWYFTGPQLTEFKMDWEYHAASGVLTSRE